MLYMRYISLMQADKIRIITAKLIFTACFMALTIFLP